MAAPNLTATVPPGQRFRVVYRLSAGFLSSGLFAQVARQITERWYANPSAIVISPAPAPTEGGSNVVGRTEAFTSLDIMAAHQLGTVSWDAYLAPMRSPSLGLYGLDMSAELDSVTLLNPADLSSSSGPAARTAATAAPASASKATGFASMFASASNRILLLVVLIAAVVLAVRFGPAILSRAGGSRTWA